MSAALPQSPQPLKGKAGEDFTDWYASQFSPKESAENGMENESHLHSTIQKEVISVVQHEQIKQQAIQAAAEVLR
jgi:hypothetical protein